MKKEKFNIGCSSYATASWLGIFYPEGLPKKQWFEYYSKYFTTYELNSTFYRFPTVKTLAAWYDKTPEGFTFSIKAPKLITHIHKFENCKEEIDKFYAISLEGLSDKLGCILFQLPPSYSYSNERLQLILNSLDSTFKNIVEFRNESWWQEDVFKAFKENNITFCSVNYPKLPSAIIETSNIGYARMHGNPKLFYSEYSKETIKALYNEVKHKNFDEMYIYFNNTASTAAIINAIELQKLFRKIDTAL